MFQMKEVGRKIAEKRKAKDMTQMELADLMGVSFQAVSNWERGNSMPDIGKLPELAIVLDLSIDELLTNEKPAQLVRHILDGDEKAFIQEEAIKADTIAEVAPILKAGQTESLLENIIESESSEATLHDLAAVAPFVSDEFLREWAMRVADISNVRDLTSIAPFLSDDTLDALVERLTQENVSVRDLTSLAPFLSDDAINKLAERCIQEARIDDLSGLAPFVSEKTLDIIAHRLVDVEGAATRNLTSIAPFLSEKTLDWLAMNALKSATPNDIRDLAPFLSQETLQLCANDLIARYGLKGIKDIAPFL